MARRFIDYRTCVFSTVSHRYTAKTVIGRYFGLMSLVGRNGIFSTSETGFQYNSGVRNMES
jgi:hypothetical protein